VTPSAYRNGAISAAEPVHQRTDSGSSELSA
jgi:hypothetical protein